MRPKKTAIQSGVLAERTSPGHDFVTAFAAPRQGAA
jgi:hypothetical protein